MVEAINNRDTEAAKEIMQLPFKKSIAILMQGVNEGRQKNFVESA